MNKLIIMGAMLLALAVTTPVHASEITGTLSTDPSKTVAGSAPVTAQAQSPAPAAAAGWNFPVIVKIIIVSLVILEILVLLFVPPRKKKEVQLS